MKSPSAEGVIYISVQILIYYGILTRYFRYPTNLFEGNTVKGYMFKFVWSQGICKSKMACFTYFINTIDMNRAAEGNLIRNQEEGETGAKMDSLFPRNNSHMCIYNGGTT